jgi:archaellum component FlaC
MIPDEMVKKKITLEGLAKLITDLGSRVENGFAKHGNEIHDLTESVAHVVKHMATKDDLENFPTKDEVRTILRKETKDIREELASIRRDLVELTGKVDNIVGLPKEIDHALERIAAIEQHLGISKKIAA